MRPLLLALTLAACVPTGHIDSPSKALPAATIAMPAPGVISPINLPPGHYTQDLGNGRTRTIIVEPRRPHQPAATGLSGKGE